MTGKELQDAAVSLARMKGYKAVHFSPARVRDAFITNYAYDSKGWPDLILVGPKGLIVVEVKGAGDTLSEQQKDWIKLLDEVGIVTLLLNERAWKAGELEAIL